jgi:FtsP/CotA-like multicopper oxidase with cupredoxin domain
MKACSRGEAMKHLRRGLLAAAIPFFFAAFPANAQDTSILVQCPTTDVDGNPVAEGPGVKCKHLSGGDGMVTMADGKKLYIFSFSDIPLPGSDGAPSQLSGEYPGWAMDTGMLAANAPAPTIVVDEGDDFYLTLTNVGMAMRPDLFDPHTVHWHGFPQASSVFDGVPDASISINMGASLSYYYKANDPGTYMYHCHVEATEHMQMGMLGSLYVHARQDQCETDPGISCPTTHSPGDRYAYNDGDGTTQYDEEYPIQLGSFDPDFHDASLNVQPLPFADMKDRYFLINGRGYPDTVDTGVMSSTDPLGTSHDSQPVSSRIDVGTGQRVLLRISNLNVTTFNTIAVNGPPFLVVGLDARQLRDGAGNNMYYRTNSLTLGGGQSADVIIDRADYPAAGTYFLYTTNLHRLANDAENFGGMMTEIHVN